MCTIWYAASEDPTYNEVGEKFISLQKTHLRVLVDIENIVLRDCFNAQIVQ